MLLQMKFIIRTCFITLLLIPLASVAQKKERSQSSGEVQLGLRSTISLFGNNGHSGTGIGGHWRLRLGDRLNTEWFGDYITTDLGGLGDRVDVHVGWSVMFYPLNSPTSKKVDPYFMAGHCFDYTKVSAFGHEETSSKNRLSSAIQGGLGVNFNLTEKCDITLASQYMMHLGNNIHASIDINEGEESLHFNEAADDHSELGLEGHVLTTISVNVKIADLWK
jgi:opacity protein-like surface antigen